MDESTVISIGFLCIIAGPILGILTYNASRKKDIESRAMNQANITAQLDYISKNIEDIKIDVKTQGKDFVDFKERMIKNEESTKQAHKRITEIMDKLELNIKGDN